MKSLGNFALFLFFQEFKVKFRTAQ